jgi:molybdopterin/thiamine biosynthesis adenylyltransferase
MQRYARQIILPEIGQEGQERLRQASVLCIGAGGLGAPVLLYLAAAGIGRIGIVDDDVVDITNLQRQVLFREQDKGELKTQAAKHALMALNSDISIVDFTERFCAANAENLFDSFDIVIDGTDNFASKFLINDACVKFSKPLIYASILGFEAQVSVFSALHGPCYRCLYPAPPSDHIPNCAEAGVMGALAGIAGSVQALEAIKILLGYDWCVAKGLQSLLGRLWMLDARTMESRVLALSKNPSCPVCSISPSEIAIHEHQASCSANTKIKTLSAAEALEMREIAIFIDVR